MKVLYLNNFDSNDGWGEAGCGYALALESAGFDVVARRIVMNPSKQINPAVKHLLDKDIRNCTHCIQHVLPPFMDYTSKMKCYALCATETDNLHFTGWPERINLLDAGVCINEHQKQVFKQSGVVKPLFVVPHAIDVEKFQRNYKPLEQVKKAVKGSFTFLTIGELIKRKSLVPLLKAFHTEFSVSEPVELVIKTSSRSLSKEQTYQKCAEICSATKMALKLYPSIETYKKEVIITDYLPDEQLYRLYNSCDVFVQTSHGEGFSLPSVDAMGFGLSPIVPNWGGYREFISNETGWLIDVSEDVCFGDDNSLKNGFETWSVPDVLSLRRAMREAYSNYEVRKAKANNGLHRIFDFSYEKIGNKFHEVFN